MRRVLIIDHDETRSRVFGRIFRERMGFGVADEAGDGASAVSLLRAGAYDLVLLNTVVPSTDPVALLDAVICQPSSPAVLYYAPIDRALFAPLAAGRAVEINYPFSMDELREAIRVADSLRPITHPQA